MALKRQKKLLVKVVNKVFEVKSWKWIFYFQLFMYKFVPFENETFGGIIDFQKIINNEHANVLKCYKSIDKNLSRVVCFSCISLGKMIKFLLGKE